MCQTTVSSKTEQRTPTLVHNAEAAFIFNCLADLLEIQVENRFRVRAYRMAAQTISSLPRPVTDLVAQDEKLDQLPGVGKDLVEKIQEMLFDLNRSSRMDVILFVLPG